MILTEEEAKTKYCPETFGNPGLKTANQRCEASACMAWRDWGIRCANGTVWEQLVSSGRRSGDEVLGYCGKAGKP